MASVPGTRTIPSKVAADAAFRNARQNSDDDTRAPLLGRLDLMIGRAMLGSLRSASKEAADAGTPEDRDLHPMCTLREQTPRKKNPAGARKHMNNKE